MKIAVTRAALRVFGIFVRPPLSKRRARAFILSFVLAISGFDYLTPVDLSLSIFYLIPICLAAGWLGWRAGAIVAAVATLLRLTGDIARLELSGLPGHLWWNIAAGFIIFQFVVWLVHSLVSAHRTLEGRIAERTTELADSIKDRRRLELELLDVTARERAAIGRELHDELGQHLVATALASQVLAQQLGQERGGKEAQAIVGWIEQAIAKSRKLARGLLLARIESDRLAGELEELAANASQGGIRCRVSQSGEKLFADAGQCAQLFRIAQEAIGNALRHGRPQQIDLTLATDDQATCLVIADDGEGFNIREAEEGMGLRIMQHRAQIIGASLAVLSNPGEGTKVICRLPTRPSPSP